jgi:hypothetical protein
VVTPVTSKRYERIKVDPKWFKLMDQMKSWRTDPRMTNVPPENCGHAREIDVSDLVYIAIGHYLRDEPEEVKEWGDRLVSETQQYFFGPWDVASEHDCKAYWERGAGNWVRQYRAATAFASALGDTRAVQRLSEFPSESKGDAGIPQDIPWYALLGEYLARGATPAYRARVNAMGESEIPRHEILAQLLWAINEGRQDAMDHWFAEHMKYYLKHQKPKHEVDYKLAIDATILYHLASRLGRPINVTDDFWRDHLIIFK